MTDSDTSADRPHRKVPSEWHASGRIVADKQGPVRAHRNASQRQWSVDHTGTRLASSVCGFRSTLPQYIRLVVREYVISPSYSSPPPIARPCIFLGLP